MEEDTKKDEVGVGSWEVCWVTASSQQSWDSKATGAILVKSKHAENQ